MERACTECNGSSEVFVYRKPSAAGKRRKLATFANQSLLRNAIKSSLAIMTTKYLHISSGDANHISRPSISSN